MCQLDLHLHLNLHLHLHHLHLRRRVSGLQVPVLVCLLSPHPKVQPETGCTAPLSTPHLFHSLSLLYFDSRFQSGLFSRSPIASVLRQSSPF